MASAMAADLCDGVVEPVKVRITVLQAAKARSRSRSAPTYNATSAFEASVVVVVVLGSVIEVVVDEARGREVVVVFATPELLEQAAAENAKITTSDVTLSDRLAMALDHGIGPFASGAPHHCDGASSRCGPLR
jgi:hypothetical protein